jgi:hypothetical protein
LTTNIRKMTSTGVACRPPGCGVGVAPYQVGAYRLKQTIVVEQAIKLHKLGIELPPAGWDEPEKVHRGVAIAEHGSLGEV